MTKDKATDNNKSWFARHKVLTVIIGLVLVVVLISALGGGDDKSSNSKSDSGSKNAKVYKFTERADKQAKDVEVLPGETATIDGVAMTVTSVEYKTSIGEFDNAAAGKTYVVANVEIKNNSDKTKSYNSFDFRIQTAGGQVLDGTFATLATPLNSGDIVAGGSATGQVAFEAPVEEGHQYIIWKPGLGSERAIIQAK